MGNSPVRIAAPRLVTREQPHSCTPDVALIVVRDISGYFEDCGCSGSLRGGITRLPSLVPSVSRVNYLFVGRTIVPDLSVATDKSRSLIQSQFPMFVEQARASFEALGHTWWHVSEDEARELDAHGPSWRVRLGKWLSSREEVPWIPLSTGGGELTVAGKFKIQLPSEKNRGRDVVVVGIWNSGRDAQPEMIPSLGVLWRLASKSEKIYEVFQAELEKTKGPILSYWRGELHQDLPEDTVLLAVLRRTSIGFAHGKESAAKLPSNFKTEKVVESWSSCATCHPRAFDAWKSSRHSHAFKTLIEKGKERDSRCVPCHVQSFSVDSNAPAVDTVHAAVTCMSCHSVNGQKADTRCADCHNELTDPHKRYGAALRTICPGDVTSRSVKCEK